MPAGGRSKSPVRSGTKNPMGKDRVRDRKIKKISQMMEKRESLRKNRRESLRKNRRATDLLKPGGFRKPKKSLPPEARKTGGVGRPGGFRKPIYNPKTVKPKGRR